MTYRDEELPRDARRGDGVVLVDTTGRVVWWSAAVEAAVERVGLRWSRGMQCCQGLGCTDNAGGCLTAQALAAPDGLESRPWRGEAGSEALEGSVRARTIRTGGQDMVAFELVFRNAAGESAAAAHDVTVHALGRLSVSVSGKSRDGDWLQQRPGQVFRYLLASRGAAQRSEAIASALWPERGPSAVANVRYCIFKLREQLGERGETADSLITRDAAGYRIDLCRVDLDVDAFQAKSVAGIAAQRRGEAAQAEALLGHALELYRGEFLADDPYADWAFSEREYLRGLAGKDLAAMAQIALAAGSARRRHRAPAAALAAGAVRLPRAPDADRGLSEAGAPDRGAAPLRRAACSAAPSLRRGAGLRARRPGLSAARNVDAAQAAPGRTRP